MKNVPFLPRVSSASMVRLTSLSRSPIMHLYENGLELVFSSTIGGDEHFLEDIERSNNNKNLLSFCRVGEAEDLHIKTPKHLGLWMPLLLDDLSTHRQPKKE